MKKLILFAAVVCSTCFANAQWVQTGPCGGNIDKIGIADSFLVTSGFESFNYGQNWASMGLSWFTCLAKIGNVLFSGTEFQLLRSDNGGFNWDSVNVGIPFPYISDIITYNDSLLFVSYYGGILVSSDTGNTWYNINAGLPTLFINCLADCGGVIFAGTCSNGVIRSDNGGLSWVSVNNGLTVMNIKDILVEKNDIVILDSYGVTYKSSDLGNNWSLLYSSVFAEYKARSVAYCDSNYYIGTANGIYYKNAYYGSWHSKNNGLTNMCINCFAVNGNDIFAGTQGGVCILSDTATAWVHLNDGLFKYNCNSMTSTGNDIIAGTTLGNYRTNDNGLTWYIPNNNFSKYVSAFATNGSEIFAGARIDNYYSNIFSSSDQGNTWTGILPSDVNGSIDAIMTEGNIIYAAISPGISISFNNGINWTPSVHSDNSIETIVKIGQSVIAASFTGQIFITDDTGATWDTSYAGFYINEMAVVDSVLYAGGMNGVFRSYDKGQTWIQVYNSTNYNERFIETLKVINTCIFAGTQGGFVYSKNGNDWYIDNNGLVNLNILSIETDQTNIYAGTEGGIFKRPLSDFNIVNTEIKYADQDITIFPNPATNLVYINTDEKTTIEIINMQVQIVATKTLTDKNSSIDVSELRSGVYTLRVKTESGVVMKKIVKQ